MGDLFLLGEHQMARICSKLGHVNFLLWFVRQTSGVNRGHMPA
jgi:hypothetical protein